MSSPPYPDVFIESSVSLSCDDKLALLSEQWDAQEYKFPTRFNGGKLRKAQAGWFTTHKWLKYSVSADGVYCAPCFLFGEQDPRCKALSKVPVSDWSNIKKIIEKHENSVYHAHQEIGADNFLAVMRGEKKDIECSIATQYNVLVEKNRLILTAIVDTIVFCGRQNIALRGHEDDMGNFKALLKFQAKHNNVLNTHLQEGDPRTMYTSPNIQNELIGIIGHMISSQIVNRCNSAGVFGFIADEATDAATMEQMALCVRYVHEDEVREDFIGFAECASTKGEALAEAFLQNLQELGVDLDKMRGQGYDGASNMSGIYRGVQARIRAQYPEAIYTHCKAHCLNLAIIHACKIGYIRNMMDIVQTVAFAFNYSAKRLLTFKETLEADDVSRANMEERKRLQSLCETRWAARADALHTFLCAYRTVVTSLEQLADDGDTKASGHKTSVLQFSFIVSLVAAEHVLSALVSLSTALQSKTCDLFKAANDTKIVIRLLQNDRACEDVWDTLYDKAVMIAADVGVEPSMARNVGRQQNRANAPAQTISAFWKVNMYLPFLDHMLTELNDRLMQANDRFKVQWLIPSQVKVQRTNLPVENCRELFRGVQANLDVDEATCLRECARWRTWWTDPTLADGRPMATEDLSASLRLARKESFPNIRTCMMLLTVMPVSTATAERSFSTMRRVKTYLRSTMGTERLSGLGLMNIYQEQEINADKVVDIFANRKSRRLAFVFKV
ncbi:zinc finger MYM-type protein 1-like [Mercenaria mercenaria]|uniref:zinc finger MYM-type protein 1-like n=1 Tax=Mercenaria mercenaria TaxID=6596 RepID=UPI00234E9DA0|nr:zinc finger MYM-type protein 1-like [Mercenaria mercenaria]